MGGAGVGKSTYIVQHLHFHSIIDPDKIRGLCPHHDDDPNSEGSITYKWTKQRCRELLEEALERRTGHYAVPGTGKSTAKQGTESHMASVIFRAKQLGFRTKIVHLTCTVEEALARNQSRVRCVPDVVVLKSMDDAAAAVEVLRPLVDEVIEPSSSGNVEFMRGRSMTGAVDGMKNETEGAEGGAGDSAVRAIMALNSYKIIRKLGQGGFGKVILAQKKDNKKLFAIKALTKKEMMPEDMSYVVAEVDALRAIPRHPYIMKMHGASSSRHEPLEGSMPWHAASLRRPIAPSPDLPPLLLLPPHQPRPPICSAPATACHKPSSEPE